MKTIMVTGGAGYVGSGLVKTLLANNYKVICVDRMMFGGEALLGDWYHPNLTNYVVDLRNYNEVKSIIENNNIDAIMHLAAIVGDPACKNEPDVALQTNWEASKFLVDTAIENKIPKFMFASTCSNYGKMEGDTFVTEESELKPVSLYAELKVKFENYLLHELEKNDWFTPTALRFSTVYGLSPRMRFDLTVNEFTKDLANGDELVIFGEQFWRPYCHVRDFSNAYLTVLEAKRELVAYDVFNVGDTSQNYTKKMLAEELLKAIPTAKISYVEKLDDPRDYRVNSDKIKERLGFEISMTVPEGIEEIYKAIKDGVFTDTSDQKYYNIPIS